MLVGLGNLGKSWGDSIRMQNRGQLSLDECVPFGLLHLDGLIEELAFPQVIQHEIQEIDVRYA